MHTTYSKLCNQKILVTLNDKRKAVLLCNELATAKSFKLKDLKVESLVRASCTLIAQLITSNEKSIENLTMYCEQYLCKLHYLDEKLKTITNNKDKKSIQNLQCNNANISLLIKNIRRVSDLGSMYDSKEFAEKGIQREKINLLVRKENLLVI